MLAKTVFRQLNGSISASSLAIPATIPSLNLGQTNSNVQISASASTSVLQDTFGRNHSYLRISLTEKCNLRCMVVWKSLKKI
jgi:hypothetical protein